MRLKSPIRWFSPGVARCAALGILLPVAGLAAAPFPGRRQQAPAPIERRVPGPRAGGARADAGQGRLRGEHLAEWMNQHSSLSPEQQQSALGNEPGFSNLPQQTQQRMRDRLAQLDAMPPAKRQRVLARTEAMEQLTPVQRAQVRGAMGELGALPMDQRRMVANTFHALSNLPAEQRVQAYATGRYGPPLNDAQRGVLFDLLRVEPLLGPMLLPHPNQPNAAAAQGQAFR